MKTLQQSGRPLHLARRATAVNPTLAEANRQTLRQILGGAIQAKWRVGAPDDAFEREADAVAERVLAMPEAAVQRKPADNVLIDREPELEQLRADSENVEKARRKAIDGRPAAAGVGRANVAAAVGQGGVPLPAGERAFFEPRLGVDLSGVRVHADAEAARLAAGLSARAFAAGSEIYFGAGEYRPQSSEGRRLLAHELTHVVQQRGGEAALRRKIDRVNLKKNALDLYFSLGLYGPKATSSLAATWAASIENQWNRTLKLTGMTIDAKIHVTAKAYPTLPDSPVMQLAIPESNAVFVEQNGFRSYVEYSGWGHDHWSTGRWAADAAPMVVAHEAGHMMGLEDKYVDLPYFGSVDLPGYETDIMANFWNDNGKTEFARGWFGILLYYYFGYRS